MADICRAAQVAIRSTSIFRNSATRWSLTPFSVASHSSIPRIRQISTSPILRSAETGAKRQSTYQTSTGWAQSEPEIKKPDMAIYDDDALAPEIDLDTSDLSNSITAEERPAPSRPALRLVPRTGRTVHVGRNTDVARSFKLLSIQVAQNRIAQDFQRQRFHERPGLKRKRLKSERWQKRFKKGFKACVSRVKELTKQGW
ncbi:hypothetical protein M426DRAFT_324319 [Hypoxylon sp. CI-4A]|nr:hypothetical protein M426DRAFT_324319 [Hypoxylon sp. CI-4A]